MTTIINGSSPSITFSDGSAQTSATRPFQNRIINGAMVIDQRNAGASVTQGTSDTYSLDRFLGYGNITSKFTMQQSSTAPAGFVNSVVITSSATTVVGSSDQYYFAQKIEGYNTADLGWGTANAKTVTLSFWARASVIGTYSVFLLNDGSAYSYVANYTISVANTFEYKTITIVAPTVGTWLTTNGLGIYLGWDLGSGSTYNQTAGSWQAANKRATSGSTQLVATSGATLFLTGVQLEVGSTATSFDYLDYGRSLIQCQRYYAKMGAGGYSSYTALASGLATASTSGNLYVKYPVTMRASATIAYSNVAYSYAAGSITAISSAGSTYAGTDSMLAVPTASGASMTIGYACVLLANNNSAGYIELSAEL